MKRKTGPYRGAALFLILAAALLLILLLSMLTGRYAIPFPDLVRALLSGEPADGPAAILLKVRLSRVLGAALIGGALSLSGAAYQGMLRNPMVSPDILGASAGAGFGAALAILLGFGGFAVQLSAFFWGLAAVLVTFSASRAVGRASDGGIMVLVLTGMVVSALFSAFVSLIKYTADPYDQLPAITFWLMGGLTYLTGGDLLMILPPMLLGGIPMLLLSWRLNLLSMGDEEAAAMGVHPGRLRAAFILCATLLTSSAVSAGGMIGWIGLVIPHLARMLAGVDHRRLLPASTLLGAAFLLAVDDIARSLFPQEIPLGILTAVTGAPFFLWLLYRGHRGWV